MSPREVGTNTFSNGVIRALLYSHGLVIEDPVLRPLTRRGSFPWTYQLGAEGHRMLQHHGVIDDGVRYLRRTIYEYGRVLHELQLNAWVLGTGA
jgi:hypothetical protein